MPEVNNVDLTKLKETIATQKKEMHSKQVAMGNGNGAPVKQGKKSFLNELVNSMRTGQKSEAVEVVRAVNETVEYKKGAPPAVAKNRRNHMPSRPQPRQQMNEDYDPQNPPVQQRRTGADDWGMGSQGYGSGNYNRGGYGDEREADFDRAFQDNNAAFDRMMREKNPMVANNPKYQQMMDRHQPQQYQNEQYIVEQPESGNLEMLTEKIEKNLDKMVESAFKNVLSDIYTKQKIQEALGDFLKSDDFIKVVGQAINEIAKRNKAKQAGK